MNRSKFTGKEVLIERQSEFKPYFMGMQVSCGVCHVVWIPKYRRKAIYDQLRKYLGSAFRDLAAQKESQVMEGHLRPDHVHMLISIPPKYAVSQVVGFIKGKSAIHI